MSRRYCEMCDTYTNRVECRACGAVTSRLPIDNRCTLCEGDGFGKWGGNCERCHGGGREPREEHREYADAVDSGMGGDALTLERDR